ncbi:MAG: hypothetical protein KJN90_10395 [Gammaproteobacteria bacterium]|nr:hypothetical protein [Gammaproteobacteria bacterium]
MNRFLAVLQAGLAIVLFLIAMATLVNMVLIAMRPETISVVNTIIGQTVMIVCLVALGRILWRRGVTQLRLDAQERAEAPPQQDVNDA